MAGHHESGPGGEHNRIAPSLMADDPRQHVDLRQAVAVGVSRMGDKCRRVSQFPVAATDFRGGFGVGWHVHTNMQTEPEFG